MIFKTICVGINDLNFVPEVFKVHNYIQKVIFNYFFQFLFISKSINIMRNLHLNPFNFKLEKIKKNYELY